MISCCCGSCRTLYRVAADGTILWEADYLFDTWLGPTALANVAQCDVDVNGNIYQAGGPTQPNVNNASLPQKPLMYTLRSWNADGILRWSWSECPTGRIVGGTRFPPTPLRFVRAVPVAADYDLGIAVIVGDDSTHNTDGKTNATALDFDGNQVWRVKLDGGLALVACGATRSLWINYGAGGGGAATWTVVSNWDGSVTSTYRGDANGVFTFSEIAWHITSLITATIDVDDVIYAVLVKTINPYTNVANFDGGEATFAVARFEPDSTTASIVTTSHNFFFLATQSGYCFKTLGKPSAIAVVGEDVIVEFTERYDKASLTLQDWHCGGSGPFLYADAEYYAILGSGNLFEPPMIRHAADGTRWKIWAVEAAAGIGSPLQATPFVDARPMPDGGSIWSQQHTCFDHSLIEDTGPNSTVCPELCCDNCFKVTDFPLSYSDPFGIFSYDVPEQFVILNGAGDPGLCKSLGCEWRSYSNLPGVAYGFALFQDATGPGASLNVAVACCYAIGNDGLFYYNVYNQAQYRIENFTCDGGEAVLINVGNFNGIDTVPPSPGAVPGFPGSLHLVAIDCNVVPDGGSSNCGGFADYVSATDGGGVWYWADDGPDQCTSGCHRGYPSVLPTGPNQFTSVACV